MTRISGPWLHDPGTQSVMAMLVDAGHQAFFVGGCVRNALLGAPVSDIDIATDAHPDRVTELAERAGLKPIPTGIAHGTITVMAGHIAHQVTTYRKDIKTDGRHAVVSFSQTMQQDARRRDFTMNALYADRQGMVSDPLGGVDDLKRGRVRFIGDARGRIQEDYLRSLRFFRFHAWYGDPTGGLDADALAAIAASLDGLAALSRERIGAEIKKLLSATNPAPAMAAMETAGVLLRILPGTTARYLAPLVHLEDGDPDDAIRRLAALGGTGIKDALRLGRADHKRLKVLREIMAADAQGMVSAYRFGERAAVDGQLLRSAMLGQPTPQGFRALARKGAQMVFPITAADLMPGPSGPALGRRLRELEDRWIHSNFELSRSQLLA